jgi:hypothetical protein
MTRHLLVRHLLTIGLACVAVACGGGGGGSSGEPTVCADVSGPWNVTETATITCYGSFGSGTQTQTGSGSITMSQNGCSISFMSPENTARSGTIDGSDLKLSGAAAVVNPAVVVARNRIDFTGVLSADGNTIDLTGSGSVQGSYQGTSGGCSVSSSEAFTR